MYNDTIDVSNKIITDSDLLEIFEKMNDEILRIQRLSSEETARNATLDYQNQKWAYKYLNTGFKCRFDFYDSTTVTVDTYDGFLNLYNSRLSEIRDMWVNCHIYYSNSNDRGHFWYTTSHELKYSNAQSGTATVIVEYTKTTD